MVKKVLVVDDSTLILRMYRLVLQRYGCEIVDAMNGAEALEALSRENGVDLILLDINMPIMNGLDFLRKVQSEGIYRHIPVIIVSTEGKEEDTLRGISMGARGYVKKPFKPSDLHALIERIFTPQKVTAVGSQQM